MKLTEPKYSKAEVLENAHISSAQFDNWMLRGLIPRSILGYHLFKLTKAKYSILVIAYCRLLAYHQGQNRKLYVETLKRLFKQVAETNEFNERMVIAIDGFGKGKDCGLFENSQIAYSLFPQQCSMVPAGQILKSYIQGMKK